MSENLILTGIKALMEIKNIITGRNVLWLNVKMTCHIQVEVKPAGKLNHPRLLGNYKLIMWSQMKDV